jgi:hypothetical protein
LSPSWEYLVAVKISDVYWIGILIQVEAAKKGSGDWRNITLIHSKKKKKSLGV